MRNPSPVVPREAAEELDQPIVYSPKGSGQIFHIPEIDGDEATAVCPNTGRKNLHIKEFERFLQRRDPRLCKQCKRVLGVDGELDEYPDAAPYGGGSDA